MKAIETRLEKPMTFGELRMAAKTGTKVYVIADNSPVYADAKTLLGVCVPEIKETEEPKHLIVSFTVEEKMEVKKEHLDMIGNFPEDCDSADLTDGFMSATFYPVVTHPTETEDDFYNAVALVAGDYHRSKLSAQEFAWSVNRVFNP